jgi:SagB-type dehydrogenase family enzyme
MSSPKPQTNYLLITFLVLFTTSSIFCQELKSIKLPAPQTEIGKPLMQTLKLRQSSRSFDKKQLPLQELSNLLWAAYGINRPESGKRTAPSAMNWQEIDVYVVMEDGAYIYDAAANSLKPVTSGDLRSLCGVQDFVKIAPINFVYVADLSKASRGKDEDKKFFTAADCGFIAQNVYLYCASQGLAVVVRGMMDRDRLSEALSLNKDQIIVLSQTVGYGK